MRYATDFVKPLFSANEMAAIDRWAIEEQQISSLELMENAGLGVVRSVEETVPDGLIVIACGGGNNGGDGLVAARLLYEAGRDVSVLFTTDPADFRGDTKVNYLRLAELQRTTPQPTKLVLTQFSSAQLTAAAGIVDAILGTGFRGELRTELVEMITTINACSIPVISVDIPSGVDATTGEVQTVAIQAAATVTFAFEKTGLSVSPGKYHVGSLKTVDIGIPAVVPVANHAGAVLDAAYNQLPRRGPQSNKFSHGHVGVLGGSPGLLSAPTLAARAAMRCGVGYATCCVPQSLLWLAEIKLLEPVKCGIPDKQGVIGAEAVGAALVATERCTTVVVGPGMGREDQTADFLREFAQQLDSVLIIDADGLHAFTGEYLQQLAKRTAVTILTPHSGELARLFAVESSEIDRRRLYYAQRAAEISQATVVLKGDDTIVANSSHGVLINQISSPALATAGTGDLLCGAVGALVAQLDDPFFAASLAVRIHASAGRYAAEKRGGQESVIASDVLESLRCREP